MARILFIGRLEVRPMGRKLDCCVVQPLSMEEIEKNKTTTTFEYKYPQSKCLRHFLNPIMTIIPISTYNYVRMKEHIAIYAGSFDPITSGHLDVIARARGMFDRIIVGIGHNPDKVSLFPFDERVEIATTLIDELVAKNTDLAPVSVEQYGGLTVDFAKNSGGSALLRGIRNVTDLAVETQLAITNRQVADMETVFIVTGEAYAFTSSSLIRQIAALGGNVERLDSIIPQLVISRIKKLQEDPSSSLHSLGRDAHME